MGAETLVAAAAKYGAEKLLESDYWSRVVGEEIDIREYQMVSGEKRICYIRRGTVVKVTENPPGLLLKDVEEIVKEESIFRPSGSTPRIESLVEYTLRSTDEKIVAFDEIGEIELTKKAVEADEAMKED